MKILQNYEAALYFLISIERKYSLSVCEPRTLTPFAPTNSI